MSSNNTAPSPRELEILQHARGVDQYGRGTRRRNHFCAGFEDEPTCRQLAHRGLMREVTMHPRLSGIPVFAVTAAGDAVITEHSPAPPRLTRSQLRYEAWLRADSGVTFGEWIRERP